jgi:uncharacterized coiled-coil DUF342 family protein
MYMPTLSGYDVQRLIEALNNELSSLNEDIAECKKAIMDIRQKKDPETARRNFNISWSLSTYPSDVIDQFKQVIKGRKLTARWIRRERAIYLWELRLRKVGALKMPLIRHRIAVLSGEASGIVADLKGHMEQVNGLLERYQQVSCEMGELQAKVRKLSLENQQIVAGNPEIPAYMKETTQKYLQELNRVCVGAN